jgi:hypothetical protein
MYDDGFCSLCYTTNSLKDGCLASIGPPYNENMKMGTSVLLPEHCDILHMCNCKGSELVNVWWEVRQYFDSPDACAPATSAITDSAFTRNLKKDWFVDYVEH